MTTEQTTTVNVSGNVSGTIIVGDNNLVVHDNYGTIIQQQAGPRVQPRNLSPQPPRKPRTFIGRRRELAQLETWIGASEPVILHGIMGLGKTTLGKQAANTPAALSQPNGVAFVEGIDEAGQFLGLTDLVQRLFDALFESDPHLKVDLVTARTYLSNMRPFVLLNSISLPSDQLEKLLDLFPSAPILVATENTPRGDAFLTLAMPPLAREESLSLLADRSGLALSEETRPSLEALADLLADVPAALALAANSIREGRYGLDALLEGLRAVAAKSTVGTQAALERIYALMWASLSADEKQMLLQTAAAPGLSVNRQWLEHVAGGQTVSGALEALELLQANSPRLRLMPGLRSILQEREDLLPSRVRLLQELLSAARVRSSDFEYVRDELGNLLGLFFWCLEQARWDEALKLGRALDPYLTLSGLWEAWFKVLTSILEAARLLKDRVNEGWALHQLGTYHLAQGQLAQAQTYLRQACSLREELGDEVGLAYSQHNLRYLLSATDDNSWWFRPGGGLLPGLIGILVVVILAGAAVFSGVFRGPPPPSLTPIPSLTAILDTPTPFPTSTSPPVPTATFTARPTSQPTDTATLPPGETSTPTLFSIPTFAILDGVVTSEASYCFYGPGRFYLGLTGLIRGNPVQVTGRAQDLNWVYVNFPGVNRGDVTRCWVQAGTLEMSGAFASLEVVYPDGTYRLPPSRFPPVQNVAATRSGDLVTVTWDEFDLPLGERESEKSARYLVEAWLCQDGVVTFSPLPVYSLNGWITLTDEAGCTESSHARVLLAEKHGYAAPVEVRWPPHPDL